MGLAIGIDPSLRATGVCVLDISDCDPVAVANLSLFETTGRAGASLADQRRRITQIAGDVARVATCAATRDVLVALEGPAFSRGSQSGHHQLAGLWWLIVDELLGHQVDLVVVPPSSRARYATGRGNASKESVVDAVARRYPTAMTRGDNNLVDALVLACMAARHFGSPVERSLPQSHVAAMSGLRPAHMSD